MYLKIFGLLIATILQIKAISESQHKIEASPKFTPISHELYDSRS